MFLINNCTSQFDQYSSYNPHSSGTVPLIIQYTSYCLTYMQKMYIYYWLHVVCNDWQLRWRKAPSFLIHWYRWVLHYYTPQTSSNYWKGQRAPGLPPPRGLNCVLKFQRPRKWQRHVTFDILTNIHVHKRHINWVSWVAQSLSNSTAVNDRYTFSFHIHATFSVIYP